MPRNQSPNLIAGGTINPSVFVMATGTHDNTVLQATANANVIGISQIGTKYPQGVIGATGEAAANGDNIEIFGLGDICPLLAGANGFTAGNLLVADLNGAGTPAAQGTTGQNVGAVALETTPAGQYGRVQVLVQNQNNGDFANKSEATVSVTSTLTAAQILGGFVNSVPAGAITLTLPTAAAMVAGVPNAKVGDTVQFMIENTSGGANTITLAAGGATLRGGTAIAQNKSALISLVLTNVGSGTQAYTAYSIISA